MYKTLVRILQEIKPYKKKLIVIAVTGVLYAVVYARLALILKDINDSFQSGNQDKVGEIGLIAISMALVVAATRYWHIFTMNYVAELITNAYRLKLQKKFMELNLSFHGQYSSGSGGLLSRIINDIKVIQDGLRMVADLFREPLLAVLLTVEAVPPALYIAVTADVPEILVKVILLLEIVSAISLGVVEV